MKNTTAEVCRAICSQIEAVTGNPAAEIDLDQPFTEMGIESLQGVTIIAGLSESLKRPLPATVIFDYPTVRRLAQFLAAEESTAAPRPPTREEAPKREPVAIIGMSCRFPGAASVEEFWSLLKNEGDAIAPASPGRLPSETARREGGFLPSVTEFDNEAFGISDPEALKMDPQQRLLLMTAWEALEDAGYSASTLSGSRTGIFVGISSSDYSLLGAKAGSATDVFDTTGNAHSIAANRLSYFFNFTGPSEAIDTACSSSLVALHQAAGSLLRGEADYALCGGVNVMLLPEITDAFAGAGMLAPDSRCKSFSDRADGYVRGEGVGALLLKRLSDAVRDQDPIHAVILGSAVNQDGRSAGLTAPNGPAQQNVITSALRNAGLRAEQVGYVEAHGTGTALGDPIEYLALGQVMGARIPNAPCRVGSVKTNIGHLEAAAGIAGLIKTALCLREGVLPRTLHFERINPKIGDRCPNLAVVSQTMKWPSDAEPRRAGVSSFGFGGTNAHVVLQEYRGPRRAAKSLETKGPHFLSASATDEESLRTLARSYADALESLPPEEIADFCAASVRARSELPLRLVVPGTNVEALKNGLRSYLEPPPSGEGQLWARGRNSRKLQRKLAFLYTGQGSQFPGMAKSLFDQFPSFREAFEDCSERFDESFEEDLYSVALGTDPKHAALLERTDYGQAALFAVEYALTQLYVKEYSLEPAGVFGHSLGEIVAACVAGAINLDDATRLVASRGKLMQSTAEGAMTAVFASAERVSTLIEQRGMSVHLAAINGPATVVVSGAAEELDVFEKACAQESLRVSRLRVNRAFHSSLMDPVLPKFYSAAQRLSFSAPKIPLVSSLHGEAVTAPYSAEYWKNHLRQPTQFLKAMHTLESLGFTGFLEIGPRPTLGKLGRACLTDSRLGWFQSLYPDCDSVECVNQSLAALFSQGYWQPAPQGRAHSSALPKTVFQKKKFWAHSDAAPEKKSAPAGKGDAIRGLDAVTAELLVLVGSLLQIAPAEIDIDEPLIDLGADSLTLLNAIQTIKDKFDVAIAISDVFQELSTLRKIAHFVTEHQPTGATSGPAPREIPASASQAPLANREKKGVLGNFKTFSEREAFKVEDDKKAAYLATFVEKYTRRTAKTKQHAQQFRKPLADNRVSAGFRPNLKEMIYPILFEQANGSHFTDFDGNEYIDFTMGFGANLFGHSPEFIQSAVLAQMERGLCVGPQSSMAGPVAAKMAKLTGMERVAFLNSGTEAVMTAIRLARAATKREKIAIFDGSYHGHSDGVLAHARADSFGVPVAPGVTRGTVADVLVLEYGTPEALEMIRQHASELAAVLVEPVQSRFPELQPREFLKELRAITERAGTALIFDEVITGFRIAPGGAQEHFGVRADIGTYGKILGGGLPIGAIAGQARFLDAIDGGHWHFGDPSYPKAEMTFFAGTFCKHPLAMAAANAVLDRLTESGNALIGDLNRKTAALCEELNAFFEARHLPIRLYNFGSLFRFKAAINLDLLFYNLNLRGIYVWEGRNLFYSTAHSAEDARAFVEAVIESTEELLASGFFVPKELTSAATKIPEVLRQDFIAPQRRFQKLQEAGAAGEAASHICLAVKMKGPLKPEILRQALEAVMDRYDVFRLRFNLREGKQWLAPNTICVFERVNLLDVEAPWRILDRLLREEGARAFKLEEEPCIRFRLFDIGEENAVFSLVCHHVAIDGWSMAQFIEDISQAYRALELGSPVSVSPAMQFSSFLANPERFGTTKKLKAAREYWEKQFPSAAPALRWPNRPGSRNLAGGRVVIDLESRLYNPIKAKAQALKVTPLMLMLAPFARLLREIDPQSQATVGVPAPNRDLEGADRMMGNCSNLLPIRLNLENSESDGQLIQRLKAQMLSAYSHMVHPVEELADFCREPLFGISFNFEPLAELPDFNDVTLFIHPYPVVASEFDLTFNVSDLEYFYHIEADFRSDVISAEQVTQWIDRFSALLEEITKSQ